MESFLKDFAQRTIVNLEHIERYKDLYEYTQPNEQCERLLFEFTQLMNSLLGLIVIPLEASKHTMPVNRREYKNCLLRNESTLEKASGSDYNAIKSLLIKCSEEQRLFCDYEDEFLDEEKKVLMVHRFITHIRNAIAHGGSRGLHFFPIDEHDEISHVIFYDNNEAARRPSNEISEFSVKLSVIELRDLVLNIKKLYCEFEDEEKYVHEKLRKYKSDIFMLESLMKLDKRPDRKVICFDLNEK